MFIFGIIVGLVAGLIVAALVARRHAEQRDQMQRTSSSQFRRITALEKEIADAKLGTAQAVRNERLRNTREFNQYKTLLRRADTALAQAKADRANGDNDELQAA